MEQSRRDGGQYLQDILSHDVVRAVARRSQGLAWCGMSCGKQLHIRKKGKGLKTSGKGLKTAMSFIVVSSFHGIGIGYVSHY